MIQEKIIDSTFGNHTIDYTYDAVGNRLTLQNSIEGLTFYTYDANNRLLTEIVNEQITAYSYDLNGNILTRNNSTSQSTYNWNHENRLIESEVITSTGINTATYRYNSDGIRIASIIDGVEIRYLIDANQPYAQIIEEYTPEGETKATYTYGQDLISQNRNGLTSFYVVDGLGSTRALTNNEGNVTDKYTYDGYGQLLNKTGTTTNNYLYTGEQFVPELNAYYLRDRYYDQSIGRFISKDPWEGEIQDPRTLDGYQYGANNPIIYVDPSGNSFLYFTASSPNLLLLSSIVAVSAYHYAVNSANVAIGIHTLASAGLAALSELPDKILIPAVHAINIVKQEAIEELSRRRNELNEWHLIIQEFTGIGNRISPSFNPPIGSPSFVIYEKGGNEMRILGARIRKRNARIPNELIARADYHPIRSHFPNHNFTIHYHLGPNANSGTHYVLWPEVAII